MRVSIIQMAVTGEKSADLAKAGVLLARAAAEGADMAVLPEMFCCPYSTKYFRSYAEPEGGAIWGVLSQTARDLGMYLVGGSMPELDGEQVYNTSYVFDRQGKQIAKHRKVHLFDVAILGGQHFRESDVLSSGDQITLFETEFGTMGLCICFDFRFQEMSRLMADQGARLLVVPGAFNMTTGPAHWELLFRQRAVDNQVFTLGAATARNEKAEYISYGNSILVDPWGQVLARAGSGEALLTAQLDLGRCQEIQAQLPIRTARRTDLY